MSRRGRIVQQVIEDLVVEYRSNPEPPRVDPRGEPLLTCDHPVDVE